VRHADKAENSRDPDLSSAGILRADRLASLLGNAHIQSIFSTDFKRTIQTAKPLSDKMHLPVQFYSPDTLNAFANRLKYQQVNTLVIGHSNSTISLLDALGLPHTIKVINDSDYSNLFRVIKHRSGKMKLKELQY
jgi:phosphohistidine phosphatase SixA